MDDALATVSFVVIVGALIAVAANLSAAGIDMTLFFNTVGFLIFGVGVIGAIGIAVWLWNLINDAGSGGLLGGLQIRS